jgi:hypothetical protein
VERVVAQQIRTFLNSISGFSKKQLPHLFWKGLMKVKDDFIDKGSF